MDEAAAAAAPSKAHDDLSGCCCPFFVALAVVAMLVAAAYGVALPVRPTVTEASLARLNLVVATTYGAHSVVSVAYNLSLTVQLRNRNWAMRVELAAPLDAELRFAGRRLDGARLADPGTSLQPRRSEEFRVFAASSSAGVPVGDAGAGAAAELAREHAEGVFHVELRIAGEVRYRTVHAGRRSRLEATCPLKMLMPNSPRGTRMVVLHKGVVTCY